jgi:large subunit ribosomal protein L9
MRVLLIQDVDELGLAGEVKEVANGFGRNFLIPQGLAVLATAGAMNEADLHRRRAAERRQRLADEMAALAEAVRQTTLIFQAKAGEKGRLYGSVTTADIADKLGEAVGKDIDRRRIKLDTPIKELGTHTVTLRLGSDIAADFDVVVESLETEEPIAAPEVLEVVEPAADGALEILETVQEEELETEE